jgi:hypothetical protein
MSSGDMTTYVRGKQEERGNSNETFMMDGFDRWAESDAPNRVGGMYKEPAERTRRRRRGRGLDTFDSESESDSDSGSDSGSGSEGYGRRRRRRGGAINFSDSSESSDSSDFSDSSEELSGGRHRRGRRHRRGGDDVLDFFTGNQSSQPMSQSYEAVEAPRGVISGMPGMGYKMADDGQIAMASAQLTDDQIREQIARLEKMLSGKGRHRRRHRRGRGDDYTGMGRGSGSSDDSESDDGGRMVGGDLPNIVKYADMAQQGYDLVKGYLPDSAKQYVDKIFALYNTLKQNASMFKATLSAVTGANAPGAIKIKEKIEQLGFGRMPMRHSYKAMKMLDRKTGSKTHKLLKKMFGAGWLTDQAGDLAYKYAPVMKDSARIAAKSAVDRLIASSPTAAKIDGFVESGVDMYNNVKANMPAIRSAMNKFKEKVPRAADSIDKVDSALKAVGLGRKGKRAPSQRNMMVSKMMREKGLSLGEASKQVSAMLKRGGDL